MYVNLRFALLVALVKYVLQGRSVYGARERICVDGTVIESKYWCDFVDDCPDGSDEIQCASTCNFENGICNGWTQDDDDDYDWLMCKRSMINDVCSGCNQNRTSQDCPGPNKDHTHNSLYGSYMYVNGRSTPARLSSKANFVSPMFSNPSPGCTFSLWLNMYGAEIGNIEIKIRNMLSYKDAFLTRASDKTVDTYKWIYVKTNIPNCVSKFKIVIEADDRSKRISFGGFAIDDLRFDDCGNKRHDKCLPDQIRCKSGQCYHRVSHCDYSNDCCDGTDEQECGNHTMCDFKHMCVWKQLTNDNVNWNRKLNLLWSKQGNQKKWFQDVIALRSKYPFKVIALSSKYPFKVIALSSKYPFKVIALSSKYPFKLVIEGVKEKDCTPYVSKVSFTPEFTKMKGCDFEKGLCDWVTKTNTDSYNFTRVKASELKAATVFETRPSIDHTFASSNGHYLHVADGVCLNGDGIAELYTWVSSDNYDCRLHFWYDIFIPGTSSLHVTIEYYNVVRKEVWKEMADVNRMWTEASVLIGKGHNMAIIIQAKQVTEITGGISIDDVSLINCERTDTIIDVCMDGKMTCLNGNCIDLENACNYENDCGDFSDEKYCEGYPASCDFEYDFCDWKQDSNDDLDWLIKSSKSPYIGVGPISDHTFKYDYGKYIYVPSTSELSAGNGKVARLVSPMIKMTSHHCKLRLWYFIDGFKTSPLIIYQLTRNQYDENDLKKVGEISYPTLNYWKLWSVLLNQLQTNFQIVIESTIKGGTDAQFIAIDDVSLSDSCITESSIPADDEIIRFNLCEDGRRFQCGISNQCFEEVQRCNFVNDCEDGSDENECGATCGFDTGWCGWKVTKKEGFNWMRSNGKTSSPKDTRPRVDHTNGGTFNGYYVYLQTSDRNGSVSVLYPANVFLYYSPTFQHCSAACTFSMWYHMNGYGTGTLSVYIRTYVPNKVGTYFHKQSWWLKHQLISVNLSLVTGLVSLVLFCRPICFCGGGSNNTFGSLFFRTYAFGQ
ncbi:MAM and LDL-receptor class A domain-containing protein 1-like [Antedon mediterranea]|uniref:MAM and LDL-receptor class A domain-containing protein 1-like n=1 Tax=Antedon mediterranea TaxID=105859 RepID=UPI003AF989EE